MANNHQNRKNFNRKENTNYSSTANNYNNKSRPPRNNYNSNGGGCEQNGDPSGFINSRGVVSSVNDRLKRTTILTNGTANSGVQDQVTISVNI